MIMISPQLGVVARLDTCITLVDSAEFHSNLGSMETYEQGEATVTIAGLLLNPRAKVLKTIQSKLNVMEILNTPL